MMKHLKDSPYSVLTAWQPINRSTVNHPYGLPSVMESGWNEEAFSFECPCRRGLPL